TTADRIQVAIRDRHLRWSGQLQHVAAAEPGRYRLVIRAYCRNLRGRRQWFGHARRWQCSRRTLEWRRKYILAGSAGWPFPQHCCRDQKLRGLVEVRAAQVEPAALALHLAATVFQACAAGRAIIG